MKAAFMALRFFAATQRAFTPSPRMGGTLTLIADSVAIHLIPPRKPATLQTQKLSDTATLSFPHWNLAGSFSATKLGRNGRLKFCTFSASLTFSRIDRWTGQNDKVAVHANSLLVQAVNDRKIIRGKMNIPAMLANVHRIAGMRIPSSRSAFHVVSKFVLAT
jgi:hypothetical protein